MQRSGFDEVILGRILTLQDATVPINDQNASVAVAFATSLDLRTVNPVLARNLSVVYLCLRDDKDLCRPIRGRAQVNAA